jgi:phosphatidylserine decarboxylase
VWWGERAVDLAMMTLFGGFPAGFWKLYRVLYPIPPEIERALPRYQVYYLLVHVYFFGSSYLPLLLRTLEAAT